MRLTIVAVLAFLASFVSAPLSAQPAPSFQARCSEYGQQFSVTRERIRQIEAKALRKLKHPSRSRKLRSFLDN